jgi:hypothetical protein
VCEDCLYEDQGAECRPLLPAPQRHMEGTANCATIWPMLISQVCTVTSLKSPQMRTWGERLRPMWDPDGNDPKEMIVHRKMWEWLFICEALAERDMLRPGRSGIAFGVGKEPLVALFAAQGCHVLASDLQPEKAEVSGWKQSGAEYADGLAGLNDAGLCDSESFARLVMYMDIDMTDIPTDLGDFDFSWSSCAFEHLGSLDAGCSFVMDQMKLLRPGGVGVHTTELNVSSNDNTIDSGGTVLFRRRDIEELGSRLRAEGYDITLDLSEGDTPEDQHVDVPPFSDTHLRTTLGEFVTTSVGLIIEKPVDWTPPRLGLASRIRNRIGSL